MGNQLNQIKENKISFRANFKPIFGPNHLMYNNRASAKEGRRNTTSLVELFFFHFLNEVISVDVPMSLFACIHLSISFLPAWETFSAVSSVCI